MDADLKRGNEAGVVDQALLLRYLTAEKNKVAAAATRLRTYAKWRSQVPFRSVTEAQVAGELSDDKVYLGPGTSKDGHVMIVVVGKRHIAGKHPIEETKNFVAYVADTVIAATPPENKDGKFVLVMDLDGVGFASIDIPVLKELMMMLGTYYPERLNAMFMFNAPRIFWAAWKVVSPFVDPVTKEKIKFIYPTDMQDIRSRFEWEDLPEAYGGTGQLLHLTKHGLLIKESSSQAIGNRDSANAMTAAVAKGEAFEAPPPEAPTAVVQA